ncbi:MAG TPA: RNA polymerase sigma factor [Polyangiaceae bacterium]|nr:RNA polymerase sigma factor [Polyangiaceae bacterium]
MPTDEELMAKYLAGDREAFRELFRRYAPVVLRLVRRNVPPVDAHDLVQLTFLHLHRGRKDFRTDARLRPWLCTIAINVRRQYLRSMRAKPATPTSPEEQARVPAPGVSDVVGRVRAALAELPADQQEVIMLHWMEGLSFLEVSEVVGASLSAVKVRAHRGYEILREHLKEPQVTARRGAR